MIKSIRKGKLISRNSLAVTVYCSRFDLLYNKLNLELHIIASKIFIEITLNSLINLFRFYFNILYNK